jgi:hypothetical protein
MGHLNLNESGRLLSCFLYNQVVLLTYHHAAHYKNASYKTKICSVLLQQRTDRNRTVIVALVQSLIAHRRSSSSQFLHRFPVFSSSQYFFAGIVSLLLVLDCGTSLVYCAGFKLQWRRVSFNVNGYNGSISK